MSASENENMLMLAYGGNNGMYNGLSSSEKLKASWRRNRRESRQRVNGAATAVSANRRGGIGEEWRKQ
jgi:hypothetical protein